MSPSLAAFQSGLCRALRGEDTAPLNADSAGFAFTAQVRRTWCERRAFAAARQVLLLAPAAQRRRLVEEYVDAGGGLALFLPTESESFLPFLAARLPDPSHALTVCRMSIALGRARSAAASFVPPAAGACQGLARRGRFASLVWFHADPAQVMAALRGATLRGAAPPPLGPRTQAVLFAPGLSPEMFRIASEEEAALWESLPSRDGPACAIARLAQEGAVELAG